MKPFRSQFVPIRGLRYHVRTWGDPDHRRLLLLHGWMDVSASFQFVVDALAHDWYVIAPDWRGFGLSDWAPDGYWFPDYFADLDALLDVFSPGAAASIVGHSMGGNVAGIYAGVRPGRVARLVLAEGFGLKPTQPSQAPDRFDRWLKEQGRGEGFRAYATLADVAARLRKTNPRLTQDKARFLAYLQLPRFQPYMNPRFNERPQSQQFPDRHGQHDRALRRRIRRSLGTRRIRRAQAR